MWFFVCVCACVCLSVFVCVCVCVCVCVRERERERERDLLTRMIPRCGQILRQIHRNHLQKKQTHCDGLSAEINPRWLTHLNKVFINKNMGHSTLKCIDKICKIYIFLTIIIIRKKTDRIQKG